MEKGLYYATKTIRAMVDNFLNIHEHQWRKINEEYKKEHGFSKGKESLSLQSYIGSDLLIDFIYLAKQVEEGAPFTNEYWIRSMGTQCIRNDKDREDNRVFSDILGKMSVTFDGTEFTDIHWIQDGDCLVNNELLKENKLYRYTY